MASIDGFRRLAKDARMNASSNPGFSLFTLAESFGGARSLLEHPALIPPCRDIWIGRCCGSGRQSPLASDLPGTNTRVRPLHLIARRQRGKVREQILKVVFRGEAGRCTDASVSASLSTNTSAPMFMFVAPVSISGPPRVSVIEVRARAI